MERTTRNLFIAGIGLAFLLVVLAVQKNSELGSSKASAGGGKISWLTALNPGLAKAKETSRPIMIDFYADWCGPCKMLDKHTYSDDRVAAASTNWVMVRIDVDKNQGLASYYNVHPDFRGRGLARALVTEVIEIARQSGLERIEAEFVGAQDAAMKTFAHLGFNELFRLPDYVKDMQAINHDYILMGLELITDEEYAGMG